MAGHLLITSGDVAKKAKQSPTGEFRVSCGEFYLESSEPLLVTSNHIFFMQGRIFNLSPDRASLFELLLSGELAKLNQLAGSFCGGILHRESGRLKILTDRSRSRPLMFRQDSRGVLCSINWTDFDRNPDLVDQDWLEFFFKARDWKSHSSPLKGVETLPAGCLIDVDSTGIHPIHYVADSAPPPIALTLAEVADKTSECLSATIDAICGSARMPGLFLSDGIDSQSILSDFKDARIRTYTHERRERLESEGESYFVAKLNQRMPVDAFVTPLPEHLCVADWPSEDFIRPEVFSWDIYAYDYKLLTRRAKADGCDVLLMGQLGDCVFLHRYFFLAAWSLSEISDFADLRKNLLGSQPNSTEWRLYASQLHERLLRFWPAVESSYCFRPNDVLKANFLHIWAAVGGRFREFALRMHEAYIPPMWIHEVLSGIPTYSPFSDHRLLEMMLSLRPDQIIEAILEPEIEDLICKKNGLVPQLAKKADNYFPYEHLVPVDTHLVEMLDAAVSLYEHMDLNLASHYRRHWERARSEEVFTAECFRVLNFYNWLQGPGRRL